MKTDEQIQKNVLDQLKWSPLLKASEIEVAVTDGIVTLSGKVNTYFQKRQAEKEARKVMGVKAIHENLQVSILQVNQRSDSDIAQAVLENLKWNTCIPEKDIKVNVENGVVTLEGDVEWSFERDSAFKAVMHLAGVRNILNKIQLKQKVKPKDLKKKINAAFHRSATLEADKIQIEVYGSTVILSGEVRSLAEKEDAEYAVLQAPGILSVNNLLELEQEPELTY